MMMQMLLSLMMATLIRLCHMSPATQYNTDMIENNLSVEIIAIIPRVEWKARKPKEVTPLQVPVPYVVIHHSHSPSACNTTEECARAMRIMQDFHMDVRKWWDIGYNFGVGGDGEVYEGRGWDVLGAHALHFNTVSIGICLIGDWSSTLPPREQLVAAQELIREGVILGYIHPDYKLVGHRQVRDTLCPGDALYREIRTWSHFSEFPASVDDLPNVAELPESMKKKLGKETKS